jgi:O-6-methylguanine DNA methyltransferase
MTNPSTAAHGDRLLTAAAPPDLLGAVLDAVGLVDRYIERTTPIGSVFIAYNSSGVSAVAVADDEAEFVAGFERRFQRAIVPETAPRAEFVRKIDRALAGERVNLTYDLRGVSDFGRAVLAKAREIPAGQVRPYGWIAAEIGKPNAVRAVGTALGHNPVPLLIPCHRVVRTDGRIGDYAFGSPAKRAVLAAEGVDPDELERLASKGIRLVGSATTKIFCHPTCASARRISRAHRVPFVSAAAAVTAGYRPCLKCRPVVHGNAAA